MEKEASAHSIIRKANAEYRDLGLAYSGGKDSIVLLELVKNAMGKDYRDFPPVVFYDMGQDSELAHFVLETTMKGGQYNMFPFCHVPCKTIKEGLEKCSFEAVLMGTRRTDPFGARFDAHGRAHTMEGWPPTMCISPIIDWHHEDVWNYIDAHQLKYPAVYDQGYTSLGQGTNRPHPELKQTDGTYKHARHLSAHSNDRQERDKED
jgi:3'-phosphoadenosine 5'-phosphosulfate sulfotransferase (PAPS reductase)/FAD synthetase